MAGIRTCDRESQVQRPNHYTTEPPKLVWNWPENQQKRTTYKNSSKRIGEMSESSQMRFESAITTEKNSRHVAIGRERVRWPWFWWMNIRHVWPSAVQVSRRLFHKSFSHARSRAVIGDSLRTAQPRASVNVSVIDHARHFVLFFWVFVSSFTL